MREAAHIDRRGLREFGLITGALVAVLFGLFFPWLLERPLPLWPWLVTVLLGGWALAAPQSLHPVYKRWMQLGLLLSKITTPIILGIVFFGVMLPVALIMRAMGHDPMRRKFDNNLQSYRNASHKAARKNVERPY